MNTERSSPENEYLATAIAEMHTKCSGCEASVLLPEFRNFDGDVEAYQCQSCRAVTCVECWDVGGGCQSERCDHSAGNE